jgi:hypothetical protein
LAVTWWAIRCISRHQSVLEDASPQLHFELAMLEADLAELAPWLASEQRVESEIADIGDESVRNPLENFPEMKDDTLRGARALFWVELAHARLKYGEVLKSQRCLEQALHAIGMQVSLIGKTCAPDTHEHAICIDTIFVPTRGFGQTNKIPSPKFSSVDSKSQLIIIKEHGK